MEAQANTTREQSYKKRLEVGDPRMEQMEEQEKKVLTSKGHITILHVTLI